MPDANQGAGWTPPAEIPREEIIRTSEDVLARPEMEVRQHEDLFRIREVGLDWDIGAQIYAPADASRIAVGADGKKIGIYLLSGGAGDFKSMEPLALLLAGRFGYKVATALAYGIAIVLGLLAADFFLAGLLGGYLLGFETRFTHSGGSDLFIGLVLGFAAAGVWGWAIKR